MQDTLTDFIHQLDYAALPQSVQDIMQRSLLDTLGVAAIGSQSKISSIVREFANSHMAASAAGPKSRLLFDGRIVSPMGASMAGAFTIDSIDAHDGNSDCKGHAGSAVLPSVLAIIDALNTEGRTISGTELLTTLAVAYEIAYRSGVTQHATVADYHTSGAWTAVGIAAATARLLKLDASQTLHAMGIAEYHGPRSQMMRCIDHPTMLRDGVGWGAPTGVSAAYMAQLGFTGAPAITIEAEHAKTLGQHWEIERTHYKAYPVCRWAHSSLDAIQDLMKTHQLTSRDIARMRIQTFHEATRLAGHAPKNIDELTYAIAFPAAMMAVRGQIGVEELREEVLQDKEILRLSHATELVETAHYNAISKGARWADVTLYLHDGREIQSAPRTPKGDPDNPLSDEEIHHKYQMFTVPVLGQARADAIEHMVHTVTTDTFNSARLLDLVC